MDGVSTKLDFAMTGVAAAGIPVGSRAKPGPFRSASFATIRLGSGAGRNGQSTRSNRRRVNGPAVSGATTVRIPFAADGRRPARWYRDSRIPSALWRPGQDRKIAVCRFPSIRAVAHHSRRSTEFPWHGPVSRGLAQREGAGLSAPRAIPGEAPAEVIPRKRSSHVLRAVIRREFPWFAPALTPCRSAPPVRRAGETGRLYRVGWRAARGRRRGPRGW